MENIHIALALFLHSLKLLCHRRFLSSALLELLFHAGQPLLTILDLYDFHDQAIFRRLQPAVGRLRWRGPLHKFQPIFAVSPVGRLPFLGVHQQHNVGVDCRGHTSSHRRLKVQWDYGEVLLGQLYRGRLQHLPQVCIVVPIAHFC
jgi:hypothetical protein